MTEFLYDRFNPVQETSGVPIIANNLSGLGIDEIFLRVDVPMAISTHFLNDALGSAVALTDSAGTVQTEYAYEPFGRTNTIGAQNGNSYQYTGRENDGSLYYYRSRYYHPGLQRFISEDLLRLSGGDTNLYAYVRNRPTVLTDPDGSNPIAKEILQRILKWIIRKTGQKIADRVLRGIFEPNEIMSEEEEQRRLRENRQNEETGLPDEPQPSGESTSPKQPHLPQPSRSKSNSETSQQSADDCAWDGARCGPVAR